MASSDIWRMNRKGLEKKRYSASERESLIKGWQQSGLSKTAYCKVHYIKLGAFYYWCSLYKKSGSFVKSSNKVDHTSAANVDFMELNPGLISLSSKVEIHYPNGVIVKTDQNNIGLVKELIHA